MNKNLLLRSSRKSLILVLLFPLLAPAETTEENAKERPPPGANAPEQRTSLKPVLAPAPAIHRSQSEIRVAPYSRHASDAVEQPGDIRLHPPGGAGLHTREAPPAILPASRI